LFNYVHVDLDKLLKRRFKRRKNALVSDK